MLTLVYINVLHAMNIIKITLIEAQSATKHEEFGAYVFKNNKYKTSLIYGLKIILAPTLTHHHIQLYLKFLRPLLVLDSHRAPKDRHLFVPSKQDNTKKTVMAHNLITSRLSKCFNRAKVYPDKPSSYHRVSCSRIRFSIIMELVSLGEDSLNFIAHCYGKHGVEVCKKHYIQFFSNQKAAELSWKAYERCRTLFKEEQKAANVT